MPNHIDDIFKAGLENYQIDPDPGVWSGLSKSLVSKEGKVTLPWYFNPRKTILAALLVSMASFGGGYFYALFNDVAENPTQTEVVPSQERLAQIPNRPYQFNKEQLAYVGADQFEESRSNGTPSSNSFNTVNTGAVKNSTADQSDNFFIPSSSYTDASATAFTAKADLQETSIASEMVSNIDLQSLKVGSTDFNQSVELMEADEMDGLGLPTAAIEQQLNKKHFKKHYLAIGYQRNQVVDGRTSYDMATNSKENWTEYSRTLDVKYGVNFTKNLGFVTGVAFHQNDFTYLTQEFFYPVPGNNANPEGPITPTFLYQFSKTDIEIPVAVRWEGRNNRFGYHALGGASLMNQIQSSRTFRASEPGFESRDGSGPAYVYNPEGRFNLYGNAGIDIYVFKNAGISLDAVLRKRLQATFMRDQFEGDDLVVGAQASVFIKF